MLQERKKKLHVGTTLGRLTNTDSHAQIPEVLVSLERYNPGIVLSHSVVSDSLQPHGLYSPPGSSVHGIL